MKKVFFRSFVFINTLILAFFIKPLFANDFFIEGIQPPAWLEKNNSKSPLTIDTILEQNDRVLTGNSGKVWLKMADGAIVKLGNEAEININSVSVSQDPNTSQKIIEAGLEILIGAFRYTTAKLEKQISQDWQRQIDIRLAPTATIGIRGTDLWGKVNSKEQFVVLLEGNISITPNDNSSPVNLDQALQIFKTENGQALPVDTVDMDAVQALAPETELDFGKGVQNSNGRYKINLTSTKNQQKAERLITSLAKRGFSAQSETREINGNSWTRICISNLLSREDAENLGATLRDNLDIVSPWVQKI
jgi:hypothetical protein